MQSLHDLRVIDLLNAASLLGYEARGICFGIQVENMTPATIAEGLTPDVYDALPLAVDSVLAELVRRDVRFSYAAARRSFLRRSRRAAGAPCAQGARRRSRLLCACELGARTARERRAFPMVFDAPFSAGCGVRGFFDRWGLRR